MIPLERIEQARLVADLPSIVRLYTELRRRGRGFVARCCFHEPDTHPSLSLFRGRDGAWRFHCFVCNATGDPIAWVQRADGVSFPQAVERLVGPGCAAPWTPAGEERARQRKLERDRRADCRGKILGRFLRVTRALHGVERELPAAVAAYETSPNDPVAARQLARLYDVQTTLEYWAGALSQELAQ